MKCLIANVTDEVTKAGKPYCKVHCFQIGVKKKVSLFYWDSVEDLKKKVQRSAYQEIDATWDDQYPKVVSLIPILTAENQADYVESYFENTTLAKRTLDYMISFVHKHTPAFDSLNEKIFTPEVRERFYTYPAALSMHHTNPGGLLQHTFEVFEFVRISGAAFENFNFGEALEGALLHDIAKLDEYIVKGLDVQYSPALYAFSHLARGAEWVAKYGGDCPVPEVEHVKHIIMSHHFNPEWGAVKTPATPEAFMVFCGDYSSAMQDRLLHNEFDVHGVMKTGSAVLLDFHEAYRKQEE